MIKEKLKKFVSSLWFWGFVAVVIFFLTIIFVPKLSEIISPGIDKIASSIYPGIDQIAALEDCGISADEFSLLEKLDVKADSWTECFLAQKALKEYYKNELENSHRKVREALGPVGSHF